MFFLLFGWMLTLLAHFEEETSIQLSYQLKSSQFTCKKLHFENWKFCEVSYKRTLLSIGLSYKFINLMTKEKIYRKCWCSEQNVNAFRRYSVYLEALSWNPDTVRSKYRFIMPSPICPNKKVLQKPSSIYRIQCWIRTKKLCIELLISIWNTASPDWAIILCKYFLYTFFRSQCSIGRMLRCQE